MTMASLAICSYLTFHCLQHRYYTWTVLYNVQSPRYKLNAWLLIGMWRANCVFSCRRPYGTSTGIEPIWLNVQYLQNPRTGETQTSDTFQNHVELCWLLHSDNCDYDKYCLLGCDAVQSVICWHRLRSISDGCHCLWGKRGGVQRLCLENSCHNLISNVPALIT
jgi:hypothetical protein